jgi:hypothetical protein
LTGLWLDILDHFPAREPFIRTFETWPEEMLHSFEARPTSGPGEGINNKARVIRNRADGLKSADSWWSRRILDRNRGKDGVLHTIGPIRQLVAGFRAMFSNACT